MSRFCGVTGVSPREGENMYFIRLAPEDVAGETNRQGQALAPGLYQVIKETWEKFGPRVVARLQKTHKMGHDGKLAHDDHGQPVMTLPADATLATVAHNMLM